MNHVEQVAALTPPAVLLVDASIDEREMYAAALKQVGYDIREAATSAEALQDIRVHRPDVIVADVCLPVVGGLDLLRLLRHDRDTSDIPVIILSGYAGTLGELKQAADLGANAVRIKPLAPESLITDIAEVIAKSCKLRAASADVRMRAAELRHRAGDVLRRAIGSRARAERATARSSKLKKAKES